MTSRIILKKGTITLVSLLLVSCSGTENESMPSVTMCYQNSFGSGEVMDFEVLQITVADKTVEGEFHWLPAFKDRRIGYFKGTKTNQVVLAKYDYMQEGKKASTNIKLILNDGSVSISGGESSLGLTSEIPQIDCKNLTEVPLAK